MTVKKNNDGVKTVSSFEQWTTLANTTEKIKLPSGAIVELRRLNLLEEACLGHISIDLVNESMAVSEKFSATTKTSRLTEKELSKMMTLVNQITVLATVNPKVENEDVLKVPVVDRMFIFGYINKVPGSENLLPFRTE